MVHQMLDCHSHLALSDFDSDRAEVLKRARQVGVGTIIVVGEDYTDSLRVLNVCKEHPQILRPCIGLHPDRFAEKGEAPSAEDIKSISALAWKHRSEIVAIGEVGLDYRAVKSAERRALQRRCLELMVALANQLGLPLNVHSRSAGHYTLDLLASCNARRVLMHAFDGKAGHAQRTAETHGWIFSIPPSIVRSPQKQKLVRAIPLESLTLESDSPVLGPEQGQRNEPANLTHAVRCISVLKEISEEKVREATTQNALKLFNCI